MTNDVAVDSGKGPLKVGDAATSRGQLCTILEIDHNANTCKLAFSEGGVNAECDYTCIYKGNARDQTHKPILSASSVLPAVLLLLRPWV